MWVSTRDPKVSVLRVNEVTAQLSLAVSLKISVTILFFIGAVPEEISVWGAVDQDINLNIPGFQMSGSIDDVLWKKDKTKIAQFKKDRTPYELKETYQILANGTLKIKQLKRNDSDTYKVTIYNTQGKNWMEKTFVLKILGKSLFPKLLYLSMGAI